MVQVLRRMGEGIWSEGFFLSGLNRKIRSRFVWKNVFLTCFHLPSYALLWGWRFKKYRDAEFNRCKFQDNSLAFQEKKQSCLYNIFICMLIPFCRTLHFRDVWNCSLNMFKPWMNSSLWWRLGAWKGGVEAVF